METNHMDQVLPMPRIGDMAPDFKANTTVGSLTFSEFAHKSWVVLLAIQLTSLLFAPRN